MLAKDKTEWAKLVKQRDGQCMDCGKTTDLHAHHVLHRSTNPELTLELDNGKTLCYTCHKAEHERNRPPRIRSKRPQRRTLEAIIKRLELDNANQRCELDELKKINSKLIERVRDIEKIKQVKDIEKPIKTPVVKRQAEPKWPAHYSRYW